MLSTVRGLVSGGRERFCDDEFDLDLTYITPELIAMGYPAENYESYYRNSAGDVERALRKYHSDHYFVFNTSWRPYESANLFSGRIMHAGCLDHHPMPLEQLLSVVKKIDDWLKSDNTGGASEDCSGNDCPQGNDRSKRAVAVHCTAGKGRTGMVIAAYLAYSRIPENPPIEPLVIDALAAAIPPKALADFESKRGAGVRCPSQKRYVEYTYRCAMASKKTLAKSNDDPPYTLRLIAPLQPPQCPSRWLRRIVLSHMPKKNAGGAPIIHILDLPQQHSGKSDVQEGMGDGTGGGTGGEHLLYSSAWAMHGAYSLPEKTERNSRIATPGEGWTKTESGKWKWSTSSSLNVGQRIGGDILLRFFSYDNSLSSSEFMFRTAFHTGFLGADGVLNLSLDDLDDLACLDLPSEFTVGLNFDPLSEHESAQYAWGCNVEHVVAGDGAHPKLCGNELILRAGFLELRDTSMLWGETWRRVWCVAQPGYFIVFTSKAAAKPELSETLDDSTVKLEDDVLTISLVDSSLSSICLRIARESGTTIRWLEDCDSATALENWVGALCKAGSNEIKVAAE